jgi:hypothetical protein
MENDSTPLFTAPTAGPAWPVRGSIHNAFTTLLAASLFRLTENEALLPKYNITHWPSLWRAARFSTCLLVFPPLAKIV